MFRTNISLAALAAVAARRTIGRARAAGDTIVFVQHVSSTGTGLFAAGGSGVAIRPAILAAAGDGPIVTKQFADAFQEIYLRALLTATDVLLVCGMMTQNCVVFTAMSRAADDLPAGQSHWRSLYCPD